MGAESPRQDCPEEGLEKAGSRGWSFYRSPSWCLTHVACISHGLAAFPQSLSGRRTSVWSQYHTSYSKSNNKGKIQPCGLLVPFLLGPRLPRLYTEGLTSSRWPRRAPRMRLWTSARPLSITGRAPFQLPAGLEGGGRGIEEARTRCSLTPGCSFHRLG